MKLGFVELVALLAWYAAVAFTAWALWGHGHPGWACFVALVGAAAVTVEDRIR